MVLTIQTVVPLPAPLAIGYFSFVRTLFTSALFALACGCADSSSRPSGAGASPSIPGGPDPVILRVARSGGLLSAYPYPGLDSVLWRSVERAPALDQMVAFGAEDGYLASFDQRRAPVRIDLRLGTTAVSRDTGQTAVTSFDGASIYTLTPSGDITRFTPSGGTWNITPTLPTSALFAVSDGSLIVAGARGKHVVIWRVRPPGSELVDTLTIDVGGVEARNGAMIAATAGMVGDRIYFGANESVIAIRTRDMFKMLDIDLGDPIAAIVPTPSGDRMYVALEKDRAIRIVDRFEERVSGKIKLPSPVTALRIDPMGRLLLAHSTGDSVYVVSVADGANLGSIQSSWRNDLPQVLADGAIAMVRGDDVVMTKAPTLADGRVVNRGGLDFWYSFRWNGFRPRAAGLDQPVEFRRSAPRDTSDYGFDNGTRDSSLSGVPVGSAPVGGAPIRDTTIPHRDSIGMQEAYTVSFAAVQSEAQARSLASRIRVDGQSPRITLSARNGTTLYRVVMGPFPTREAADRVGKVSGYSFWIFEGVP